MLQNNGSDSISVSANGIFTFAAAIANGSALSVAVLTQPAGQTYTVINGTGAVRGTNATSVSIACSNRSASH